MNSFRPAQAVYRNRIGTAVAILLFACCAVVHAQDTARKKRSESPQPAGNAARPAPQTPAAATPKQPTPDRPARQSPEQRSQQDGGQAGRANRPDSTQSTQQNAGRANRPDSTQGTQQNAGRSNRPDSTQSTQEIGGRPIHPDSTQGTQQNAGRSNRPDSTQGTQQNAGRSNRPNPGQPGRDEGRPGVPNPGQNARQNPDQRQSDSRGGGPRPQVTRTSNGGLVHRDSSGQVRQVHTPGGAVITHRPDGSRRIEMVRPGNRTVVTNSRGFGGYVQRPLMVSNRQFVQRTYSVHGMSYVRVYRPVTYRGVSFHVYTPMHSFRPAFYAYVYNPWARPIIYDWSWNGRPWYGYYSGYFAPYPAYSSPVLWLTDYMIGSALERGYEERVEGAGFAPGGAAGMTPEVKQAVADEVRRQLDLERAESQSQNAAYGDDLPIFADNARHVLLAFNSLEVSSGGRDCMVTAGDVLQLYGPPPADSATADAIVLASKGMDCRRSSIVSVPIQDLQEMQNDMRATIDQGLADFQSRHGKGGLPVLPPSAAGSVLNSSFATVTPDANVATELTNTAQEADRAEQAVVNEGDAPGGSAGPITISLGQTIDEVVAIQGQPQKVVDLGAKKIYVYKDMKITFTDGKVSDVQ
jgi:hypothetical protein